MCERGMSVILLRSLIAFYDFIVVFNAVVLHFSKIYSEKFYSFSMTLVFAMTPKAQTTETGKRDYIKLKSFQAAK